MKLWSPFLAHHSEPLSPFSSQGSYPFWRRTIKLGLYVFPEATRHDSSCASMVYPRVSSHVPETLPESGLRSGFPDFSSWRYGRRQLVWRVFSAHLLMQ